MPFTSNRGFSVQAAASGAGVWGTDGTTPVANSSNALNEGLIQILDQALGGTTTLSLSNTTPILLTQVQAQKGMLRCTGTLLSNVVISPDSGVLWTGIFCWENVTSGSFSVTITNSGGSVVLPQGRRGLLWIDTTVGPRIIAIAGSTGPDAVPTSMTVPAYNSSTPAGYSVVSLNDYGLQVVSSGAGVTSGSVAYSTLFARTTTDNTTLTLDQIPSHTHDVKYSTNLLYGGGSVFSAVFSISSSGTSTGSAAAIAAGGGGAHSHGLDMRVQTAKVILVTRN